MKLTRDLGFILLGVWLIIAGAAPLLELGVGEGLRALLALAAGLLILFGR